MFATALVGLVVYMAAVGLSRASLIAEVAGFFVALAGLTLAVADRYSPWARRDDGQDMTDDRQDMTDVVSVSGCVGQEAPEGTPQHMTRVTAWHGVYQRIRSAAQPHSRSARQKG